MDEWKRSGQIPAFGNWDFANELPITQYFECARQAGLVRYSSSSGESVPHDLYAVEFKKPLPNVAPSALKKTTREREKRCPRVKENVNMNTKTQGKGKVARKATSEQSYHDEEDSVPRCPPPHGPKPVDEDLYKIPPELLRTTRRKRMLGFISKCLVAAACD